MDEKLKPCPCKTGEDYSEIWLAPRCDEESGDGRLWCKDAFVFEPCPDCNSGPVKYVRADLFESARAAGYAAGIADAAKVALDYTAREDDYPSAVARDFYESAVVDAVSDIAESIRALSTSEKGEPSHD